jgi:hypothetical protein
MRTKMFFTALLFLCFTGSAFSQSKKAPMTPIAYNDQMADITDSLYKMGQAWGLKFSEVFKGSRNFGELTPYRKNLTVFINRKTELVKKQALVGKGAEGLKSAMLGFLNFENKMVDGVFVDLEKLSSTSTQENIDVAIKQLTAEAEKENEVLKLVNAAQEAYGEQNGFAIEAAPKE